MGIEAAACPDKSGEVKGCRPAKAGEGYMRAKLAAVGRNPEAFTKPLDLVLQFGEGCQRPDIANEGMGLGITESIKPVNFQFHSMPPYGGKARGKVIGSMTVQITKKAHGNVVIIWMSYLCCF